MWKSTRGLSHDVNSVAATKEIVSWLDELVFVSETAHLNSFYRFIDARGSDVRLDISCVLNPGRQTMCYAVFACEWTTVQAYCWLTPQHINVPELIACVYYLRSIFCRTAFGSIRFFHVVEITVMLPVLTKGRISSRIRSRTFRRMAALVLTGDLYPVPF